MKSYITDSTTDVMYIVISTPRPGGDQFEEYFATLEDANAFARNHWNGLTKGERSNGYDVAVGCITRNMLDDDAIEDGQIDWRSRSSADYDVPKGAWHTKEDTIMANINRAQERVYWGEDNGDGEYLFVLGANDEMLWAAGYNHADRANELRDLNEYKKPDADITGWAYGYLDDLTMAVTTLSELRESYECRFVFLGHYTDDVVGRLEAIFA